MSRARRGDCPRFALRAEDVQLIDAVYFHAPPVDRGLVVARLGVAPGEPQGAPLESRQIAHCSPGWMTSPPSAWTRASASPTSGSARDGSEKRSPGPGPKPAQRTEQTPAGGHARARVLRVPLYSFSRQNLAESHLKGTWPGRVLRCGSGSTQVTLATGCESWATWQCFELAASRIEIRWSSATASARRS